MNGGRTAYLMIAGLVTAALCIAGLPAAFAEGATAYNPHGSIVIIGDAGFTPSNGVVSGSGSALDPYVIEGWDIDCSAGHGIVMQDTNAYFIIRNCYVHNGGLTNYGIILTNCDNGQLVDNVCLSNFISIYLTESSDNNLISNNTCSNSVGGICTGWNSANNLVIGNTCDLNEYYGIYLHMSTSTTVAHNVCTDNYGWGILVQLSSGNLIWNNTLVSNNGAGDVYDPAHAQGFDDGNGDWWNTADGVGNRWSDWTAPDDVPPFGVVDLPYPLAGNAGAMDHYPLTDMSPAAVDASVEFEPSALNPKSNGKWLTAYIELPEGYSVDDIQIDTIELNDRFPATGPSDIGDFDMDDVQELMVKFDRTRLFRSAELPAGEAFLLTVSGTLEDGTSFEGTDEVKVVPGSHSGSSTGSHSGASEVAGISTLSLLCMIGIVIPAQVRVQGGPKRLRKK